ncbi:ABC transporter substrate-binding protein [Corynebacterium sp. 320]|uniref:ABC transporter substrate-binding protein n=1 Tax=Corynebacterium TaxID=1716 RepID=UPI00125CAFD1|nr:MULTISPECIES: ABC transporter substrate-binding protein [Corynebacterium]KAB1503877.1 ABC transporter substrate-binding protein [Corynebacterium sp. 320]KAB1553024.1 ABC transporter substrate-binding protein [Corynebacterium sp. 321]KAB1553756.1 ABC transporter substrate-binding protein [Corynebacterium sp. 319]KAB3528013.1 ABC transporter substrate-binding protein [Corynebacterium sp. 250]KAB3540498.1 ABC transporter substrate-binding protein [Corynebacterium sp. 366]
MALSPRAALLSCGLTATLLLTACGESEPVSSHESSRSVTAAKAEGTTQFPLTVDNCGQRFTFTKVPERVVSLDQGMTEIMLSLGLQEHMVGTASWTDPVLPELEEANNTVERLSDNAPTYEAVMDKDPDLVVSSFGRHYKKEGGVATRDRFGETDTPALLSYADCEGPLMINGGGTRTTPLTADKIYKDIEVIAEIFDVSKRGQELIDNLKHRVALAQEKINSHGETVGFWFADTKTPYFSGGYGFGNILSQESGLTNIFASEKDDWIAATWEDVVDKNPDILVLGDLERNRFPGDKLADKKEFLATDPVTKTMDAVKNEHFITLHGAELNPSIRFADALEKIAAYLEAHDK